MGINEYIKIGSRIKELRKSKGITQREMAKKLNLSFSTYSNYENNYREPKFELIEKIADILGVTLVSLIGSNSSDSLQEKLVINHCAFMEYLYTLGYSVETSTSLDNSSSFHYISYDNRSVCKVVDANAYRNFQKECDKYVKYLMNNLLNESIDLDAFMDNKKD